jgi:HEAT repeat protein
VKRGKPSSALLAIANSGAKEFYDDVLPLQSSDDAGVRDAAIQAIRLMQDARVEPRLVELLQSKNAGDLRAALHALRPRSPEKDSTVSAVERLALDAEEPMVRREAVLVLKKWQESKPAVSKVLDRLKAKETDERVLRVLDGAEAQQPKN